MKPIQNKKTKNCKSCKKEFIQYKSTVNVCSKQCYLNDRNKKESKIKKENEKNKIQGKALYKHLLRTVTHTLIKILDKEQKCISLGKDKADEAGHFFGVGRHPALKYHLLNIYSQSHYDNCHLNGNESVYSQNLLDLFGKEVHEEIMELPKKYKVLRLAEFEIIEAIKVTKQCIIEARELPKLTQRERIEWRVIFNKRINIYK